ncbi:A/G-specific adenine glycosylase [Patescibacteria group bacterium]|nr:A/G-specific adenine glycosylase [Patescibacteria group bacterium]
MKTTFPLSELQQTLLRWWRREGRVLPWRQKQHSTQSQLHSQQLAADATLLEVRDHAFAEYLAPHLHRDPYRVVVAELMLQQTQVDRVLPKYLAWMKRWPTTSELAQTPLAEVLIFWQGLGYNRRARFLWLLAQQIEERSGKWPQTEEELLKLPGIGKYTARAIMSFAFGLQVAVVDTNVKRVLRRLAEGKEAAAVPIPSEKEWFAFADSVLPADQADPWNQLIMDFGALVCTAKAPRCENCPAQRYCAAQKAAVQAGYQTYREYLAVQLRSQEKSQKKMVRFEDTDRYFRGRIMDILRQGPVTHPLLAERMEKEFGLSDQSRLMKLVQKLSEERLVTVSNLTLKLG